MWKNKHTMTWDMTEYSIQVYEIPFNGIEKSTNYKVFNY